MTDDPIVNEVRAVRDAIAKEHDYDIGAIFDTLRAIEARSAQQHVSHPARKAPEQAANAGAAQR